MTLQEVLKRDFVYWDVASCEVVLEKEPTKPDWAYIEMRVGCFDDIITEYYKDGNLGVSFSYGINFPKKFVAAQRMAWYNEHKGNWTKYMVTMPLAEYQKTIEQYYFE